MLKIEERKEERAYLVKLIEQDKACKKGHLSLNERDKITILLTEGYSISKIAKILIKKVGVKSYFYVIIMFRIKKLIQLNKNKLIYAERI